MEKVAVWSTKAVISLKRSNIEQIYMYLCITCLYKVIHKVSIGTKMYDFE